MAFVQKDYAVRKLSFIDELLNDLWVQHASGEYKPIKRFIGNIANQEKRIPTLHEMGGANGKYGRCIIIGNQQGQAVTPSYTPPSSSPKLFDNGRVAAFHIRNGYNIVFGTKKNDSWLIILYKVTDISIELTKHVSREDNIEREPRYVPFFNLEPQIVFYKELNDRSFNAIPLVQGVTIDEEHPIIVTARNKMSTPKCRHAMYLNILVKCSSDRKDLDAFNNWAEVYRKNGLPDASNLKSTTLLRNALIHKASRIRQKDDYDYTKMGVYYEITLSRPNNYDSEHSHSDSEYVFEPNLHFIIFYNGIAEFHARSTINEKDFDNDFFKWLVGQNGKSLEELSDNLNEGTRIFGWLDYTGN